MNSPIKRVDTRRLVAATQKLLGATRQEVSVVFLILFGLLAGSLLKLFKSEPAYQLNRTAVYNLFDSAAVARTSTYSGVGADAQAIPELAAGDTIVIREDRFPPPRPRQKLTEESIDLNTAGSAELQKLPGVGPKTAAAIILFRERQSFRRPEDLMRVKGIGTKTFAKLQRFVRVSGSKSNGTSE